MFAITCYCFIKTILAATCCSLYHRTTATVILIGRLPRICEIRSRPRQSCLFHKCLKLKLFYDLSQHLSCHIYKRVPTRGRNYVPTWNLRIELLPKTNAYYINKIFLRYSYIFSILSHKWYRQKYTFWEERLKQPATM